MSVPREHSDERKGERWRKKENEKREEAKKEGKAFCMLEVAVHRVFLVFWVFLGVFFAASSSFLDGTHSAAAIYYCLLMMSLPRKASIRVYLLASSH